MNPPYTFRIRAVVACVYALVTGATSIYAAASSRPGWGATPYYTGGTGVTFRVWAPNASSVSVHTFITAPVTNTALFSEGGGIWSVDVDKVVTNQQYKYRINGTTYKKDPRSRKQISSAGNSIVYNTTNFSWAGDTFVSTNVPLNDAVIYELNIATLNDTGSGPGTLITATNRLPYLKQLARC